MLPYSDSTNAYLYSLTSFNIPREDIKLECLDIEIRDAGLSSIYLFCLMDSEESDIIFLFTRPLEVPEELTLDAIVANHTGSCVIEDTVPSTYSQNPLDSQILVYDSTSGQYINDYADHSTLKNLDKDVHTQYVPLDGSRQLTSDWNVGNYNITSNGFIKGNTSIDLAAYLSITGLLYGGSISINSGDNTKIDIEAGVGIYSNLNDRSNPIVKIVQWDNISFNPSLSTSNIKWIAIDYNNITEEYSVLAENEFTEKERRSIIVLGRCWNSSGGSDIIEQVANYATPAYAPGKSIEDLSNALGPINIHGNDFYPSDIGLKLRRTAGKAYRFSANMTNDPINPNIYESADENPINTYSYQFEDSESVNFYNTIRPDYYDSTSTLEIVPDDKWTVQKIYYYPVSNLVNIFYGKYYYDSISLAYDGIVHDNINVPNSLVLGSVLRAYLIMKKGCTDLSDETQARIVPAYVGTSGLVPGITNHSLLGGLDNDDHPQYHNDTRGDALYYRKAYIEDAENILYGYNGKTTSPYNVKTALDDIHQWGVVTGPSGRIYPDEVLIVDGTSNVTINAGYGYISNGSYGKYVSWDSTTFIDVGYLEQGNWHFYIDMNEEVHITNNCPDTWDIIKFGSVISTGYGNIYSVIQCPYVINSFGNRIIRSLTYLGPFIYVENSGIASTSPHNSLSLLFGQADITWATMTNVLPAIDTYHDYNNYNLMFKGSTDEFVDIRWVKFDNGGHGVIDPTRWNDTSELPYKTLQYSFTFTNGSPTITVSGIDTTTILDHYFIYLESDLYDYAAPISKNGISTVGNDTTITLEGNYLGSSGTGYATVFTALPRLGVGKYAKHLVVRLFDKIGTAYIVYGQTEFDSELDAKEGGIPSYPEYTKGYDIKIASLISSSDSTSWVGNIYDLRPLPFHREGATGAGGGNVATSHSALSDLNADDHLQYLRTDGTRDLTGIQSYHSHPTFSATTQLVDKKYVDDYFPVNHYNLLNIGTNTHAQIDTHIADTTIHFTKASIDHNTLINTHNLTTDIDHNLLTNTHNLTTDIDHNQLTNTHNLTTDIDHNQLTNYDPDRHFLWIDVTSYVEANAITDSDGVWQILYLDYSSSSVLSSTTSTTYQTKISITTPAIVGVYRLSYSMEYNAQQNNKDIYVRLYNSTNATDYGENSQQTNNSANWFSFSGFIYFNQSTAVSNTFSLQYRAGTASCQVRNATLELWRGA